MRREILGVIAATAIFAGAALPVAAPQAKSIYRIGFLSNSSPTGDGDRVEAFRQGMRELGYEEGKNITIQFYYAEGHLDRLPELAAQLVQNKVDVIVARGATASRAAMKATKSIPIVMAMVADPVKNKLVTSLAYPGGNVTGLTTIMPELVGKQLEMLREIVPGLSRVCFLTRSGSGFRNVFEKDAEIAGRLLGIKVQILRSGSDDFGDAFSAIDREHAQALIVQPFFIGGLDRGRQIANLARERRLPTISSQSEFAHDGGLIAFGADVLRLTRRAAHFVVKILNGAKPADLPVERPQRFYLTVNMRTAKALGITIPRSILLRADKVIE